MNHHFQQYAHNNSSRREVDVVRMEMKGRDGKGRRSMLISLKFGKVLSSYENAEAELN